MCEMFMCFSFLLFFYSTVYSFNLDTTNPLIYVDLTGSNSTYFGYSVLIYSGIRPEVKWIKIGAPKATNPNMGNNIKSGITYHCPYKKVCKVTNLNEPNIKNKYKQILDGAWIGGSMDISYDFNRTAICAFKWAIHKNKDYRTLGMCYWSSNTHNNAYTMISPLDKPGRDIVHGAYEFGQGQAGFSVHFPEGTNELILGAPGVSNWKGTVIRLRDIEHPRPNRDTTPTATNSELAFKDIEVAKLSGNIAFAYSLFGYSITSGQFFGKELIYAASAPTLSYYRGKVIFFTFKDRDLGTIFDRPIIKKETREGTQLGEYFGACIAAGDLNGDGFDDLVVGAPYYARKIQNYDSYNNGRVYIFYGSRGSLRTNSDKIDGVAINGQFGTTVKFLGDLDHDGYGDIAVSAPYEEELSGVLYIYKGTKNGISLQASQRIVGKQIYNAIKGFGISVSKAVDIDNNGYKDIVVGAYLSGHAVILRSKPVVVVHGTLEPVPPVLESSSTEITFFACFWYSEFNYPELHITRTFTIESNMGRVNFTNQNDKIKNITVYKGKDAQCENITLSLKKKKTSFEPLRVKLSYVLMNVEESQEQSAVFISDEGVYLKDKFLPFHPVLDQFRSTPNITKEIQFALGCGNDSVCNSNLVINAEISNLRDKNTFILGSNDHITLQVNVTNFGENAYNTKLLVTLPDSVSMMKLPAFCETENETTVVCTVDHLFVQDDTKIIKLDLDMTQINSGSFKEMLDIILEISTSSININKEQNLIVRVKLNREVGVLIHGLSAERSYIYSGKENIQPNITQIVKVEKTGVSGIEKINITIDIPWALKTSEDVVGFLKILPIKPSPDGQKTICKNDVEEIKLPPKENTNETTTDRRIRTRRHTKDETRSKLNNELEITPNTTFYLNCSSENVVCLRLICAAGPFQTQGGIAVIQVEMRFDGTKIERYMKGKRNILFSTYASVFVESPPTIFTNSNKSDSTDISSLLISSSVDRGHVDLWIIIVSAIGGLLLLLFVVLLLIWVGFFKRSQKDKLELLKAEVEHENLERTVDKSDVFETLDVEESTKTGGN